MSTEQSRETADMNEAIKQMLSAYSCTNTRDTTNALREILQEIVLLGLWRSKFFEHAAFYGGTALRILYGLDRFSEDLDFSLLKPNSTFDPGRYLTALEKELNGFGFEAKIEKRDKAFFSPVQSAFLKTNTLNTLLTITTDKRITQGVQPNQLLKIKIEIDTEPPSGFQTESRYLLKPLPFAARVYTLPDLFAGKMHAILCRKWQNRVKGRDWYDLVWYISNHPQLHLSHLEQRMRQSGHLPKVTLLDKDAFFMFLLAAIDSLDINQARQEAALFTRTTDAMAVWSKDFFKQIVQKIQII